MKHGIVGDLHLGVRGDSTLYRQIAIDYWVKFLIPLLKKENVQVLNILGDFNDNRNHLNVLTDNLGILLMTLMEQELPDVMVRIILGNHDIYYKNTREFHSLKKFDRFPNVDVIEKIEEVVEGGRNIMYCPWLVDFEELLTYRPVNKAKFDVIYGHFEINGFKMNGGYVEDNGIAEDVFRHNAGKVFTGHYHDAQTLGNVTYTGCAYPMDWGDVNSEKGVYILDLKTFQHKFVPNDVSPKYRKVYLSQLKNKIVDFDSLRGNFVKIYLDTDYTDKLVEKLTEVVKSKNPISFMIEGFGTQEIEMNLDVNANVESPIEALLAWVESADIGNLDKKVLFQRFKEIYDKVRT